MPTVGFEPTIAVLERAITVRVLDRAATAIGKMANENKVFQPAVSVIFGKSSETTTEQIRRGSRRLTARRVTALQAR
jgi:hypothetical protein